jgi:hypothetical protein
MHAQTSNRLRLILQALFRVAGSISTRLFAPSAVKPTCLCCEPWRRQSYWLAEGSSDIRILKRSLEVLYPERQEYFSFFNHEELSVDGGANYLVKFIKAFAAAHVAFRMVAVFDNDTAGVQAFRQAADLSLPDNILLVRLPDIELARTYPTIGPQGEHIVDVNGQAASLELCLGRAALTEAGRLRPVRWTSYVHGAKAYQGEVEGKSLVQAAFFVESTRATNSGDARMGFPELVSVWAEIFEAVERSAAKAVREEPVYNEW